ncbi:MAG: topology modulation protein [Bosea sp. (in: a-proteobacteria)]
MNPQRILVIGCSGAGKSTLGRKLAEKLALPLIHLDAEYWLPGWQQPSRADWREKVTVLAALDQWVMDGNYGGTFDLRMPRADVIVLLDLPRLVCLRGILWRPLRYWGKQRPDMGPGCVERYDWPFVKYVWSFRDTERPKIMKAIATLGAGAKLVHLRSRREVAAFLSDPSMLSSPKAV